MENPFAKYREQEEPNPFLKYAQEEPAPEQDVNPFAKYAEPVQAEAVPADDFSGFFTGTPLAPAEPAAPTPARVRTERDQEFAPGEELVTGVKAGAKGLANLPAIFALQKDADVVGFRQKELDAFASIDAGKEITPAEASRMGVDYARIRNYQKANPEQRQEQKAFNQQTVDKAKVGVQEGLKLYAEFAKEMEKVKGRTPDATDIETATDFANWLAYNVGSGAVQIAPVILAAVTTGGVGAFGVGTALAGQETLQNRLQFILEQTKGQTPQEQADAVENYLRETGNTNALIALGSGALDLAGPVGTILRKQLSKEAGKEAVKYATKKEAAKAAVKRAPRELLEEGATGAAQEALQIGGERYLAEQTGDVFSDENIKRVINAAAAEAAGGVAGSGFNVATSVGQQYVQERAAADLKRQLDDRLRQANAEQLGPVFDALVTQVKAQNPGMSEIAAYQEAGRRLTTLGGPIDEATGVGTGGGEPSVSVPSGEGVDAEPAAAVTGAGLKTVGVPSAPAGDVGDRTKPVVGAIDPAVQARADEIIAEGADQGATIPMDVALRQAETEIAETVEPTVLDATQRLEDRDDADLALGILEDEQRRAKLLIGEEETKNLQDALELAKIAVQEGDSKRTFFDEDVQAANEFVDSINNIFAGLEAGTLQYSENTVKGLLTDANNLKETFTQRIADRDKFEAERAKQPAGAKFEYEERPDLKVVSTAGTPAADPVGFARLQAAMSFDKRNSSDYSDPEEAIDFGLDNLNDTLTEYKVTDPYVREQAVEAYKNEIARLKGEVGTVPVDQAPAKVGRLNEFLARFKTISQANFPMLDKGIWSKILKTPEFKSLEALSQGAEIKAWFKSKDIEGTPIKRHSLSLLSRGKDGQVYLLDFDLGSTSSETDKIKQRQVEVDGLVQIHWPGDIDSAGNIFFNFVGDSQAKRAAEKFDPTKATEAAPTETVPLDQTTADTPASQLAVNPETGLKPPGKRGGRKPVVRTPEEKAAAEAQRAERQKVGKDAIRAAEKARKVVEKPFNPDDYDTLDAARAAGLELQTERDAALTEAFRILADRNIGPTSKAKQVAKTVIDHPSVDAQEKRRAQQRAQQTDTARSDLLEGSTNSETDPTYLIEDFGTATKAVEYIMRTGNAFEKLLAQRIKPFLKGVNLVIVNDPRTDIPDAKTRAAFKGATGLYVENDQGRTIYLSNLAGLEGINNMTFLHEAVHGATMAQINAWLKDPNSVSPQARAAIESMQGIMLQAYKYYAVMNVAGKTDPLEDILFDLGAFSDIKEFVAYGLTQPEMQNFLQQVPGRYEFGSKLLNRGLLTKFVQSIRNMFNMGPQYDSAFQDLVVVTDQLLRASGPTPSQGTIIAAAKKVRKQNKTLEKILKSTNASDKNAGIGQLIMETRNAKNAIRLLRSTFDALTVGSIRKIMPTMTTEDITRWAGDRIVNLQKVNDAVQDMAGMRAKMIRELAERVPQWVKFGQKYEKGGRTLGEVMHASTLLAVDPTQHKDLTSALNNDSQLQKLKADYQAALADPAKTPRQRTAAKGAVTKRENEIKTVYQGGTVINPDTNEKYTIEGWEQLGKYGNGEGHAIFKMAKDAYKDTFDLHQQLLIDKITKANIPGQVNNPSTPKGKLIAQITQTFQEAQQLGIYFPLMRYGNFWLRIGKGKSGEFYMFESATARNNYARQRAEEAGKTYEDVLTDQSFEVGDDLNQIRDEVMESSQMLKDIFKALEDGSVVDPTTGKAGITDIDAVKDQVYQMYLMTLPDRDIRRKFTHRQGKTGFSADVLRNFITSQHTAANQLSRLAYADEIRMAIGSSYAELAGNPDALKLRTFVDEIAIRATAEMTPQVPGEFNWDALANVGNQTVFFYMLTSPKSAIVQMTQLPIVGLPVLSAEYGPAETAIVAARYSNLFNKFGTTKRDANGNVTTKWGEPSINDSAYVNKHPNLNYRRILKRAWQAGQDKDLFMATYASDMTSRAQVPTAAYKGRIRTGFRATLDFMSGAFHHLERISRETMYMSAFELEFARAKKQGLNDNEAATKAIDVATKLVYESLFNYTQYNKPRLMKANAATKLGTQFMTYPLQMTSYLVRNFYGMLPYLNREGKRDAAIKFFGTIGMTSLFAGVVGLPGYSMILGLAEGVREMLRPEMGGEDEDLFYDENDEGNPLGKRSLKLWFEEWFIPTYFGPESDLATALGLTEEQALTLQRSVKMGPISGLTDLNIGASTSLDGLWIRDDAPAESSKDAFQQFVIGLAGPFGSMGEQIASAFDEFNNGNINKGFEKLSPAFLRGFITANRLRQEGLKTSAGDQVRDAEWYTTGKLLAQSLGFQSTEVAEIQKKNFRAKQMVRAIEKERTKVLRDLDKAYVRYNENPTESNDEAIDEAYVAIDEYNYRNQAVLPITQDTIISSLSGKAKRRAIAEEGLSVDPRLANTVFELTEKTRVPQK